MMTDLQRAELAADIRTAFADIADCAWKARDAGLSLNETLDVVLPAAEELVQSIVREVGR